MPQGARRDLGRTAVGHPGDDGGPGGDAGRLRGGRADLAETGAGQDDVGEVQGDVRPGLALDVVARLEGMAGVGRHRPADQPCGDGVGLVGDPALPVRADEPQRLRQRPRVLYREPRLPQPCRLAGRACVVVHERRARRPSLRVRQQHRPGRPAHREPADPYARQGEERGTGRRTHGLPPLPGILLVPPALAPAAERGGTPAPHGSAGRDRQRADALCAEIDPQPHRLVLVCHLCHRGLPPARGLCVPRTRGSTS